MPRVVFVSLNGHFFLFNPEQILNNFALSLLAKSLQGPFCWATEAKFALEGKAEMTS